MGNIFFEAIRFPLNSQLFHYNEGVNDALLQTKFYMPAVRPSLVHRPPLVEKLNAGLDSKLTLVCAPAGFGKTTLVADWLHQLKPHNVAWLSLDENDNDPARFIAYLIAALQKIEAGIGDTTLTLLQMPQQPPPEVILTPLINDIAASSTPFILILDDYHVIQTPAIHQALSFILEHQPSQMHLDILTREDPPLPVARLRARGQVTEIRQGDLQFTTEETAVFLKDIMNLDLLPDDIAALEQRTEGWIAGLQLAAVAMQSLSPMQERTDLTHFVRAFAGSNRFILDYLIEEVFERQKPGVQDFLLKTAILDRLSAPLCDAVTDRNDSNRVLTLLEQANLFIIPLDQSRRWFRYHRLFTELLRHRLKISEQHSETALRQKAARWYETNGNITEAVNQALAAQDWPEAERMITLASAEAIKGARFATMNNWLERLPDTIVEHSIDLSIFKAWALYFTGKFEEVAACIKTTMRLLPRDASPFNRGALTVLLASLALAEFNIPEAIQLSQETLNILGEEDPYFLRGMALHNLGQAQLYLGNITAATDAYRQLIHLGQQAGHHLSVFGSMGILAWLLNLQGQRREAINLCRQALDKCVDRRGRPLPLAGSLHIYLGQIHQEANELNQALEHINTGIKLSKPLGPAGGVLNGLIALAQLQQAMGQPETAVATIQEIRQAIAQWNIPQVEAQIVGIEADILMKQGNIVAVERWAETAVLSPNDVPNPLREQDYFTYARFLLAWNQLDEAQTLLTNFEHFARESGRIRSLISIHLLQAQAAQALGRKDEVLSKLELAVRMAAPENYQRAFIEDGRPLFSHLSAVSAVAPEFVAQLLTSIQPESNAQASLLPAQPLLDPLSQRELEILQFVANGLSNREIAEKAFISEGTVKSHVHHILEKLAVSNRTQAVTHAKELGLL